MFDITIDSYESSALSLSLYTLGLLAGQFFNTKM